MDKKLKEILWKENGYAPTLVCDLCHKRSYCQLEFETVQDFCSKFNNPLMSKLEVWFYRGCPKDKKKKIGISPHLKH